jgi:hypothetical protein
MIGYANSLCVRVECHSSLGDNGTGVGVGVGVGDEGVGMSSLTLNTADGMYLQGSGVTTDWSSAVDVLKPSSSYDVREQVLSIQCPPSLLSPAFAAAHDPPCYQLGACIERATPSGSGGILQNIVSVTFVPKYVQCSA